MANIAAMAGVSRNAVSLALRHDPSISAATTRRIEGIARQLGYQRNPVVSEVMSRIGGRAAPGRQGGLALVNANADARAFERHPTIPRYVEGAQRRAREWGFGVDTFWLHQAGMSGHRWCEILETRGIRGVLIIGLMKGNRLPESFLPVVERFPCVVTGVRTRRPALNFACVDHHILARRATERAVALGYRRPGLVLDQAIDNLVEGRFVSGYLLGQEALPARGRLRPFLHEGDAPGTFDRFSHWIERARPDVLLILYNTVQEWVQRLGLAVPGDIGLIQLEWRGTHPDIAGMNQHNDLTGEAAAEMLAGMIFRGVRGAPEFPVGTLIGPTWVAGTSVGGVACEVNE